MKNTGLKDRVVLVPGANHGIGAAAVWVIWPDQRELGIWLAGSSEPRTLHSDEVLEGATVSGFVLPLRQLW